MKIRQTLLILLLALIPGAARAQCNPVLANDTSQFWVDGYVNATTTRGNILYFGGSFRHVGQYTGSFALIDTGSGNVLNRATWPKVNGIVYKAISDGTGGWIIGGSFSMAGDSARTNMAQIDASGHVTAFNPHPDNAVKSLLLVGADLYVGGGFTHIGGVAKTRLARIGFPSATVSAWAPAANNTVNELELYNGKLYVGGYFTNIGGQGRNYIAAIDTATGTAYSWNPNAVLATGSSVYNVQTIAFNSGVAYVGGSFNNIGGQVRSNAAALDTGTALANGWNPGADGAVNKIIHTGSTVYLAGAFSNAGSLPRAGFAAVDPVFGLASSLNPMTGVSYQGFNDMTLSGNLIVLGGAYYLATGITFFNDVTFIDLVSGTANYKKCISDDDVFTVGISGGRLFAGGMFSKMGLKERWYTAAIDMDADTLTQWNFPADNVVNSLAAGPSRIYIGGQFSNLVPYNPGLNLSNLAAADLVTGNCDTSFHSLIDIGIGTTVNHILYDNGSLYIAGHFGGIAGYSRNGLAKLSATNGSLDMLWNPADFFSLGVNGLEADNSSIYIGGYFNTLGTQPRRNLGAVDKINGHATAWNPSPDNTVQSLAINNGKLLVGGYFDSISSVGIKNLAKISLSSGAADAWRPNPNSAPKVIASYYTTEFIAGIFDHIDTTTINGFGSVNINSNIPSGWNPHPGYDSIYDMAVHHDKLYVVGGFSGISGQNRYPNFIVYKIKQAPDTVNITGSSTLCAGTPAHFMASTGIPGSNFAWSVNGMPAGTTADTFSYLPSPGDIVNCTSIVPPGGCYTSDTGAATPVAITVAPNVTPSVSITGPSAVCFGSGGSYSAATAIPTPGYLWRVNGMITGTGATYSYVPSNGDNIYCRITTPSGGCYLADSAISNTITVATGPPVTPTIVLSAPSLLASGSLVTVNATVNNAGSSYQINWYVNAAFASTTTTSVFTYTKGAGTDIITAKITSTASGCYNTATSNPVYIYQAVGIEDVQAGSAIKVYPDPFDDFLIITGLTQGDKIGIYDAEGKKVNETNIEVARSEERIGLSSLAPGVYLVHIIDRNGNGKSKKTIVKK